MSYLQTKVKKAERRERSARMLEEEGEMIEEFQRMM